MSTFSIDGFVTIAQELAHLRGKLLWSRSKFERGVRDMRCSGPMTLYICIFCFISPWLISFLGILSQHQIQLGILKVAVFRYALLLLYNSLWRLFFPSISMLLLMLGSWVLVFMANSPCTHPKFERGVRDMRAIAHGCICCIYGLYVGPVQNPYLYIVLYSYVV